MPRVRELAAFKAADFTAFDRAGATQTTPAVVCAGWPSTVGSVLVLAVAVAVALAVALALALALALARALALTLTLTLTLRL